ncbi:MAG TPA: hypothetical protein VF520_10385 [Thermoleophilaceae bacterium]
MCVEPEGLPATSAVAWTVRRELELAEWSAHGRRLGAVSRGVGWWIGDWLRYGNARFGERYVRAARLTGYDVQTLMNMVYVTSRFDPSRRREDLSFSHHAELAALEPAEQERWLSHASSEHLSVRCLREELRRVRRALRAEDSAELDDASRSAAALVCPECGAGVLQPSHDGA